MVLEQVFKTDWLQRRPIYSIILGFVFTFIALGTSYIFFERDISIAMLFLITLLLLPSLIKLINWEEKIEKKSGASHFFKNHKSIIEIYLFLFIGIFIAYLLIGLASGDVGEVFKQQVDVLGNGLVEDKVVSFTADEKLGNFFGIFSENLLVALIFFILSLFYGAGAIFLIVWNASVFSAFIVMTMNNLSRGVPHALGILGVFSLHLIPEVLAFLLAAIAGGVVSRALIKEKWRSKGFSNVFKDATILLVISFVVLLVAALLEAFVSTGLMEGLV